jgi:hypothetical protein
MPATLRLILQRAQNVEGVVLFDIEQQPQLADGFRISCCSSVETPHLEQGLLDPLPDRA